MFNIPRFLFGKLYELYEPLPREVILVVILLWGNELNKLYEPHELYGLYKPAQPFLCDWPPAGPGDV